MHGRESVRSSNAATVLRTLVPQARAIFKLLAEHQMEEREEGEEEGVLDAFIWIEYMLATDRAHCETQSVVWQSGTNEVNNKLLGFFFDSVL